MSVRNPDAKFLKFNRENTHVCPIFETFTRDMVGKLGKPIAMMFVLQRTRWEIVMETTGEDFKINNNYAPYYARLIMNRCPDLAGAFNLRKSVADDDKDLFSANQLALWKTARQDGWLEQAIRDLEAAEWGKAG